MELISLTETSDLQRGILDLLFVYLFQIPQEDATRKSSLHNSEQKPVLKNDYKQIPNSASANGKPDVVNPNRIISKHNRGNVLCSV
jgi:hypothetical protein